jgi:hypothetical protein
VVAGNVFVAIMVECYTPGSLRICWVIVQMKAEPQHTSLLAILVEIFEDNRVSPKITELLWTELASQTTAKILS